MTDPGADFGDALRRALSSVADVTPADGNALRRIRARANARTPRRRLQATLAIVIPWPAFRLLQYRTLVWDVLCERARWLADTSIALTASGREWLNVRGRPAAARAWAVTADRTRSGAAHAWAAAADRAWPSVVGAWAVVVDRAWPGVVEVWAVVVDRTRPSIVAAWAVVVDRTQAGAARAWGVARGGVISTRNWASKTTGSGAAAGAHAPRHADQGPPPTRAAWLRPALAAAAVAFVATLAVSVGPVRQAIVQFGSSVISVGHTQNGGGGGGGSVNGSGHHLKPLPVLSPVGSVTKATARASAKPSPTARPSCDASSSTSAKCVVTSATPVPPVTSVPTAPPSSTQPSSAPSTSPPASSSPTATPSPSDSGQAVTGPTDGATSTP
jgi:hypothetical protein